jgi:phosphate-selective porin OprO/OprP
MSQTNTKLWKAVLTASALSGAPAYAANDAMMGLLEELRKNGTISQEAYDSLVNAAKADDEHVTFAKEEINRINKETPKIETKDKLKISSPDGDFEWQPIGRIMADYDLIDSDKNKLGSGAEIRRARLGMEGKLWKYWIWKLEFDFANAEVSMKDGYIGYKDKYSGGDWVVKAGQHHIPFGLATMSSSKYMNFVERPLIADTVLQPARQIGISGFVNGKDRWTFQTGVFAGPDGEDPDGCLTAGGECDEQLSIAARGTFNPYIRDKTHLLHVGGAVWYRSPQDSEVRVRQRPASIHVVDDRFQDVNFGSGNVDDVLAFNGEAAAVWGPFHLQGEYTNWDVSRNRGSNVTLDGWYVEASYFLTGESMNFESSKGEFGGVKPKGIVGKGGIGAWQVALRYDNMDLNDEDAGINGGEQDVVDAGLNWYVTNTMRIMADYSQVLNLDRPGNVFDGDEPSAFRIRGQVYW